jgi:hypothetical protein
MISKSKSAKKQNYAFGERVFQLQPQLTSGGGREEEAGVSSHLIISQRP